MSLSYPFQSHKTNQTDEVNGKRRLSRKELQKNYLLLCQDRKNDIIITMNRINRVDNIVLTLFVQIYQNHRLFHFLLSGYSSGTK